MLLQTIQAGLSSEFQRRTYQREALLVNMEVGRCRRYTGDGTEALVVGASCSVVQQWSHGHDQQELGNLEVTQTVGSYTNNV